MKVSAIIAEYNPMHNGHVSHIETVRRETDADYIIAVMSGDYVQRGAPAIISKYERAKSALMAGADLVLELPLYYSCGSLEYFSKGAVSLISKTGVVKCISFGSESGDIDKLTEASRAIRRLSYTDDPTIKHKLSMGLSFSNALNSSMGINDEIKGILRTPNNLLGASYIAAADELSYDCVFHTMKRAGSDYHDDTKGALSSTSIRHDIHELSGFYEGIESILSERMPENTVTSLTKYLDIFRPVCEDSFSLLLFAKIQHMIRSATCENISPALKLTSYLDVSESLANKIINAYAHASSYSGLCRELKSKDLNYARISRALLHILLDIRKDYMDEYSGDGYHYYFKPLGFRKDSAELLHQLKLTALLPIISKNADAVQILTDFYMSGKPETLTKDSKDESVLLSRALRMFTENTAASELYEKTVCSLSRQPFISEFEHTLLIV